MPEATPVTTPVVEATVATVAPALLQVPLLVMSVKVVVAPAHMVGVPPIAAGNELTVNVVVFTVVPQAFVTE